MDTGSARKHGPDPDPSAVACGGTAWLIDAPADGRSKCHKGSAKQP